MKSFGGRTGRNSRSESFGMVLTVILLAVAGQAFLAQSQISWTLWPGIVLMGIALWQFGRMADAPPAGKATKGEWAVFGTIFLFALAVHLWRLNDFPAGLHMDLGEAGWCALRILHEGWRPLEEAFQYQNPFLTDFYQLAAWFALAGSSLFSIHLFFILFSLAVLPVLSLFFRRLAGPSIALWATLFMAVMRWQWVEARNPHFSCEAPLYVLTVMTLLLAGFQNRKPSCLAGATLVAGFGLYAYQSLKALPLLVLAVACFEYFRFPKERKNHQRALVTSGFLFIVLAMPLIYHLLTQHSLGKRESEMFILPTLLAQKSLFPLFQAVTGAALMFNRAGDLDPFHNLPGHRMLDDATGILFLLGLVMAWFWRKERRGAYPLLGFGVMLLPGLLTSQWWASQRYTGVLPFVAYFAALGTVGLGKFLAQSVKASLVTLWVAGGLLVLTVTTQNALTYFGLEAADPQCQKAAGPEQTFIGRQIARLEREAPGRYRYFLDPFYEHNSTVAFLGYSAAGRIAPFEISDWVRHKMPQDKDSMVFLAQDKSGVWLFLKGLFPNGNGGIFQGPDGKNDLFWDGIPAADLQAMKIWNRGLRGIYLQSARWTDPPAFSRLDPLINFSSREDFPFTGAPPFRARWKGRLVIKSLGAYAFIPVGIDPAQLWLDGKAVPSEKPVRLSAGFHPFRLEMEKEGGYYMALHLIWKKPDGIWEVVPAEAFGAVP